MRQTLVAMAIAAALCFGTMGLQAGIVAQTGFNDAVGINPADYTDGATMRGKGTGEPGWTSTWSVSTAQQGYVTTTSSPLVEGDLSAKINTVPASGTVYADRYFTAQTGVFYVDTYVQSTSTLSGDAFIMYLMDGPGWEVASMMTLRPGTTSGGVSASTYNDGSFYTWVATGSTWHEDTWVRWTEEVDVPNQTYRVWVNGLPFTPAQPLRFRHTATDKVDRVRLFLSQQADSTRTVRMDQFRVLTDNPLVDTSPAVTGFEPSGGYVNGQTVLGKGDPEPNWVGGWYLWDSAKDGEAIAQNAVVAAGQQALKMTAAKNKDMLIAREFMAQTSMVFLDFDLRIGDEPTDDFTGGLAHGLHLYAGTGGAAAFNICFDGNQDILARDGNLAGAGALEDTGVNWVPGKWIHVSAAMDCNTQTYELWFDDVKLVTLDPLSFRHDISWVGNVRFLLQNQGSNDIPVYFDNINVYLPEPATLVILGGGLALAALRRRRRRA